MKFAFVLISAIVILFACQSKTNEGGEVTNSSTVYVVQTRDTMLTDTRWKLVQLSGAAVTASAASDKVMFMLLQKDGNSVSGFSGCNTYVGTFELIGNAGLKFSETIVTNTVCDDMESEKQFISMLANVDSYDINGDTLFLHQSQTAPLARFELLRQ